MNMPEKNLFCLPFKMEFDWYLVVADKESLQSVQQIMLSIPDMCRMVIIATGNFKKANKILAEQKSIYLIEVVDEGKDQLLVFEKALSSIFIPEGKGCIYIHATGALVEITKKLFKSHSIFEHCVLARGLGHRYSMHSNSNPESYRSEMITKSIDLKKDCR